MRLRIALAAMLLLACGKDAPAPADDPGAAFQDRLETSNALEPKMRINRLSVSLQIYHDEHHGFPAGGAPLTPARSCCAEAGHMCQPDPATWATPAWQALWFQIEEPFRCQYQVEVIDPAVEAVIRIRCDFDCDGSVGTYQRHITIQDGKPIGGELIIDKEGE